MDIVTALCGSVLFTFSFMKSFIVGEARRYIWRSAWDRQRRWFVNVKKAEENIKARGLFVKQL